MEWNRKPETTLILGKERTDGRLHLPTVSVWPGFFLEWEKVRVDLRVEKGIYRQMLQLLTVFVLLSLSELVLLIMFFNLHWGLTLLWLLASGLFGTWFIRQQGNTVLRDMRQAVAEDRLPADVMIEGFLVLFAGGLLIVPGIITDIVGISILVRPLRRYYRRWFVDWLKRRFRITTIRFGDGNDIVEGEVVRPGKRTRTNENGTAADDRLPAAPLLSEQEGTRWP
jgi:UPF0716 protein FxsA